MSRHAVLVVLAFVGCAAGTTIERASGTSDEATWRSTPPEFHDGWPVVPLPPVRRTTLPNGLMVYVVELPDAATVEAAVLSRAGANLDGPARPGLASVTWATMLGGAGNLDEPELAMAFNRLGTAVGRAVDEQGAMLRAMVQPEHSPAAVELLAKIVRHPRLTQAAFERARSLTDIEVLAQETQPQALAVRALSSWILGSAHPLAQPPHGTRASLAGLALDDVRAFHRDWVVPTTTALVLAGRIDEREALRLAEAAFGDWRGAAQLPAPLPSAPLSTNGSPQRIGRPEMTQAVIAFGRRGAPLGSQDQPALELLTALLGEVLHDELREKLGLTYAVNVHAKAYHDVGLVSGTIWVGGDTIAKAIDSTLACMRRIARMFAATAHSESMLAALKQEAAQRMLDRFDGVGGAVEAASVLFFKGVSDEWLAEYAHRIDSVSPEDMRRVVARYLSPADLHIVLVANPATLDGLRLAWPPAAGPTH